MTSQCQGDSKLCSWTYNLTLERTLEYNLSSLKISPQKAIRFTKIQRCEQIRLSFSFVDVITSPLVTKLMESHCSLMQVFFFQKLFLDWSQHIFYYECCCIIFSRVPPLGSGSDYSPFCQRSGVPSADIRYVYDKVSCWPVKCAHLIYT